MVIKGLILTCFELARKDESIIVVCMSIVLMIVNIFICCSRLMICLFLEKYAWCECLNTLLSKEVDIKDLGAAKKILGIMIQ